VQCAVLQGFGSAFDHLARGGTASAAPAAVEENRRENEGGGVRAFNNGAQNKHRTMASGLEAYLAHPAENGGMCNKGFTLYNNGAKDVGRTQIQQKARSISAPTNNPEVRNFL